MTDLSLRLRRWATNSFPTPFNIFGLKVTLFFLIALIYNLLRPIKITLVVSAEGAGAEIIPFLKVWGILPGAVLFTALFTFLMNRFTKEAVFQIITLTFLAFFALF